MIGTVRIVTPPAAYPISLDDAKEFCRVDESDLSQDRTLNILLSGLTNNAEKTLTGRAFVERTLELCFDHAAYCALGGLCWPSILLPFPPLLNVVGVFYKDRNGDEQEMDSATYEVDPYTEPGRVQPVFGAAWPAVGHGFNVFRIRYQAGYRAAGSPLDLTDASAVPGELRSWMSARLCTLFDNRTTLVERNGTIEIPRDYVDGMLDDLVVGTRLFG